MNPHILESLLERILGARRCCLWFRKNWGVTITYHPYSFTTWNGREYFQCDGKFMNHAATRDSLGAARQTINNLRVLVERLERKCEALTKDCRNKDATIRQLEDLRL